MKAGRRWSRLAVAACLSALAVASQIALDPLLAQDSYQVPLGAVALSVMFGGAEGGLLALALCGAGKLYFLTRYPAAQPAHIVALHMLLFSGVAGLICWIGGRFHASERHLTAVLTSVGDGIIATDEKGRVKFMNPVAEALTGWRESAAVNRHIDAVLRLRDENTGSELENPAGASIRGRALVPVPPGAILESKTGRRFPVAGKLAFLGAAGRIAGAVIVLEDISERNQAERERERLIEELQSALSKVKMLSGILPICASCKRIRDDKEGWYQLESYITTHSEAMFSHGLCPECLRYYEQLPENSRSSYDS
jgi:PAS domain S-box-containing protein